MRNCRHLSGVRRDQHSGRRHTHSPLPFLARSGWNRFDSLPDFADQLRVGGSGERDREAGPSTAKNHLDGCGPIHNGIGGGDGDSATLRYGICGWVWASARQLHVTVP